MSGDRSGAYALLPAESMALTVGLAQVQRGEEPSPKVAAMCVLALARLVDRCDYTASAKTEDHAARDECPYCGSLGADQPCISWGGEVMSEPHRERFRTSAKTDRGAPDA